MSSPSPTDGMTVRQSMTLDDYWFVDTPTVERLAFFRSQEDAWLFVEAKREQAKKETTR